MKTFSTVLIILFLPLALSAQSKKPIVTSDVMKLATANQLQISPDGTKAVMVVTRKATRKGDEYYYTRHLYLLDLSGKTEPKQLTFGDKSDSQPTWSPDGKNLAFVRSDGGPQIWILPMEGGEAYSITKIKTGASQPKWSPDGTKILFNSSIPYSAIEGNPQWENERPGRKFGDEPNWANMKDEEKKATKASPDGSLEEIRAWLARNANEKNPRVLTRLQFQAENDLQPELRFSHLYVVEFKLGAEPQKITSGFQSFSGASWSPDGTKIICSAQDPKAIPDYTRASSLYIVDADGKNLKEFLSIEGSPAVNPSYSPDGKTILFQSRSGEDFLRGQFELAVVSATGGSHTVLTNDFDRDVSSPTWSADGKTIYFNASSEGDIPLYSIPAKGGTVTTLISGDRGVHEFDLRGDRILYAQTEMASPWEIYTMSLKDKRPLQLTSLNTGWLKERTITLPKEYWVTRPDGTKVQYWVMEPLNRKDGIKYPTILNIHGGPTAMWGPSAFSMWHEFQMQVGWGYGLVFCNPRGSGGYGEDFKRGNFKDWGTGPANDILATLEDAGKNNAWIDNTQLFVTGGSYAGYMVAWLVGHDNRFKAANCQRGVYDLTTFMGEGNAWRLVPDYFGYPWEAQQLLDANSPITFVDKITTPLLIMHSDLDLRTGVIQSEMLYKSLKILNRPVEYIRYPGEGHELSRSGNPGRMMDRLVRIVEFFERYVKHPETPPALMQY